MQEPHAWGLDSSGFRKYNNSCYGHDNSYIIHTKFTRILLLLQCLNIARLSIPRMNRMTWLGVLQEERLISGPDPDH